jgi:hypothetical protein
MNNSKLCFLACDFFRCEQRALVRSKGKHYCRWADDVCVGYSCNYATCIRGRLLSKGICGMSTQRSRQLDTGPEFEQSDQLSRIPLRGKIRRRFREDDLI